jgi:isoleucyl-tRNA synthetase
VHLELFPEEKAPDQEILARFESLLALRADVSQALEKAQRDGMIGKPLEAMVAVTTEDLLVLRAVEAGELAEIEEFLILSNLSITKGEKGIVIGKSTAEKCERCWRHRGEVGSHATHPTLCGRCVDAVEALGVSPSVSQ